MKLIILIILFVIGLSISKNTEVENDSLYHSTLLNINQWQYWQRSDGLSAHDPHTGSSGGYFPRNTSALIYMDGLVWGGYVQDPNPDKPQLRVNGIYYDSGLQPGNIIVPGTANQPAQAADPANPKFRIYRARKNIHQLYPTQLRNEAADYFNVEDAQVNEMQLYNVYQQYLDDWRDWPADLGAPYYDRNCNGQWDPSYDEPGIVGADQVLWCTMNDLDPNKYIFGLYSLISAIGLEVQLTLWAYDNLSAALGQTIFKRYRIINKSGFEIKDMYLGIWSDPDVGDYADDLCGCNPDHQMAFAYDGLVDGPYFGAPVPPKAVAFILLQGPRFPKADGNAVFNFNPVPGEENRNMSSFGYFSAGDNLVVDPWFEKHYYNMLRGFIPWDDLINPTPYYYGSGPLAGEATFFPLSGDPFIDPFGQISDVDGQGNNMRPGDRCMMLNTGPFEMAPGDTQEVVYAIVGGLGEDRLASVKQLQDYAPLLHEYYQSLVDFEAPQGKVKEDILPDANTFILGPNYPNPFNGYTNFRVQIFAEMKIKLDIYDALGKRVKSVYSGTKEKGEHSFRWNGKNEQGVPVASGIYLARMQSGTQVQLRKIVYLK